MHLPPRAAPKWGPDQRIRVILTGTDALMLSTVRDYMVEVGWHEDRLSPACVLSAALDMAVAYVDIANKRMEVGDGQ